jgi:excisionase family DNA binding protein
MVENLTQKPGLNVDKQNENNYFSVRDVADELGVSKATILRWLQAGKLDGFFRIGRKYLIRKSDFEKFINLKVEAETKERI